ncbi:MAG: PIN domain-containing protein [Halapricum sp.]
MDSKTRELIVTLEADLLTPAFVHDEIENYEDMIAKKSGMDPDRVTQFIDLLFQYIDVVPAEDFYPAIEKADETIGDTDPNDVLYLACAIATDAAIWSDDSDFDQQQLVETYATSDGIDSFETSLKRIHSACFATTSRVRFLSTPK